MNNLKKAGLISFLLFLAVLDIFVYWSHHLCYRAEKEEDSAKKKSLLEKSVTFFPWNDPAYYELGKVSFDLGIARLDDAAASEMQMRDSVHHLKQSLRINPASPFSHLSLGQSLLNLELISPEEKVSSYDEFRRAARLAGENSEILGEVGKVFLSRWPEVSGSDRDLALEILRKTLAKKDREDISYVLNAWEFNIKDYAALEAILPEDAQVYRQYAQFLGGRSLSLKERHKYLAKAELLEFTQAKDDFQAGEMELSVSSAQVAFARFSHALDLLKEIRLYQALSGEKSISDTELEDLRKSLFLGLAKCGIAKGESINQFADYLKRYLDLEDQASRIAALEDDLKDRGVVSRQFAENQNDLDRLSIELRLSYKQGKHDEIAALSDGLERRLFVIPGAKGKDVLSILQMVGDSLQERGRLVEAEGLYRKALQVDPADIATLFRLRRNCELLNDEKGRLEVNERINQFLTPATVDLKGLPLSTGQVFAAPLKLERGNIVLDIGFDMGDGGPDPLLSVYLNDRVVWDGYAQYGLVSVVLDTKEGTNRLQIVPVNRPITLHNLNYRAVDDNAVLAD